MQKPSSLKQKCLSGTEQLSSPPYTGCSLEHEPVGPENFHGGLHQAEGPSAVSKKNSIAEEKTTSLLFRRVPPE